MNKQKIKKMCKCGHLKEDHCSTNSLNNLNMCELCFCKGFKIKDEVENE